MQAEAGSMKESNKSMSTITQPREGRQFLLQLALQELKISGTSKAMQPNFKTQFYMRESSVVTVTVVTVGSSSSYIRSS